MSVFCLVTRLRARNLYSVALPRAEGDCTVHAFDHVRRVVVIDDGAGFDFFGKHWESRELRVKSREPESRLRILTRNLVDSLFWLLTLDS